MKRYNSKNELIDVDGKVLPVRISPAGIEDFPGMSSGKFEAKKERGVVERFVSQHAEIDSKTTACKSVLFFFIENKIPFADAKSENNVTANQSPK